MAAIAAIPWLGTAIAGGASATAGIYGAHQQAKGNREAANLQAKTNADAIAEERRQYDESERAAQARWDAEQTFAEQQWNATEARKAPYRAAGNAALTKLGDVLGVSFGGYETPQMPQRQALGPSTSSQSGPSSFGPEQFNALFPGDTLNNDMLVSKEAELGKSGVKVLRNAAGRAGKIQLPNGQIVDVVIGGDAGVNKKAWQTGSGPQNVSGAPVARSLAALGINPLRDVQQAPYSQPVPLRSLLQRRQGV